MLREKNESAASFIERAMNSTEFKNSFPDVHDRLSHCIAICKSGIDKTDVTTRMTDELTYNNTYAFLYDEYEDVQAAEYQGRKVTLNKPFRTPDASKKFAVYTKNESGKVVIVRFGDPDMSIKKDDPERRKSFRARHKCDTPGPKWKARYWACKAW